MNGIYLITVSIGGYMQKLSEEYILSIVFTHSIEREELLIKKYAGYYPQIKDKVLLDVIKESQKYAQEHIKMLKEKMIRLSIQG